MRTAIRVRSDIPLPNNTERFIKHSQSCKGMSRKPTKYHVDKLDVGDSFVYDGSKAQANGHLWFWKLKTGHGYKVGELEGNIRVWRVE